MVSTDQSGGSEGKMSLKTNESFLEKLNIYEIGKDILWNHLLYQSSKMLQDPIISYLFVCKSVDAKNIRKVRLLNFYR